MLDSRRVWAAAPKVLGSEIKTHLHTPKAVTYHEQSHYCRFMIGHSLGRMESRFCLQAIFTLYTVFVIDWPTSLQGRPLFWTPPPTHIMLPFLRGKSHTRGNTCTFGAQRLQSCVIDWPTSSQDRPLFWTSPLQQLSFPPGAEPQWCPPHTKPLIGS